jgi:membrane protein DedA with SNARE-associated domain
MNKMTWIGTIVWGAFVAGFGLMGGSEIQPQDVIFLIAGGMVSCLIGVVGLVGFMGWVPGLRTGQKSYS